VIALVGPRGAGKTTVGRRAAEILGRTFVDLDDEIARAAGRPAADVLRASEAEFRRLEAECLARALERGPADLVLATGGGAPVDAVSRSRLRAAAVVWLRAERAVLRQRLRRDPGDRPPLPSAEDRDPIYRAVADVVVATDELDVEGAARLLAENARSLAAVEKERSYRSNAR